MTLVICNTVAACMLAWPVDLYLGGINEHVHTTPCPCVNVFMLHGLRTCVLHTLEGMPLTCCLFIKLLLHRSEKKLWIITVQLGH